MDLLKAVANYIRKEKLAAPGSLLLAAVSGGIDSMVLADILYRLRQELKIELAVASFDHGLRQESAADLAFVRDWAAHHGLAFWGGGKDIAALSGGKNVEDVARRERYAFLRSAAMRSGAAAIASAHHRDDQAETVLLHLLRGSGLSGLSGMHPKRDGVVRPLLCAERCDIEAYAAAHAIEYRVDSTNSSTRYLRNRIRLELLPYLTEYNPGISRQLNDTAAICRDEDELLDEMAEISLAELWSVDQSCLDGPGFDMLAPALQRRVLRKAYRLLAGDLPELSYKQVESIRGLKDEQSCDLPRGLRAWRRRDLCFGREIPPLPVISREWPVVADGCWHELAGLDWSYCAAVLDDTAAVDGDSKDKLCLLLPEDTVDGACWRTRRDGDHMLSAGRKGRCKVKDIFIEQHIAGYLRAVWPLLVSGSGETLWVPGLRKNTADGRLNNVLIKVRFSDKIKFNSELNQPNNN